MNDPVSDCCCSLRLFNNLALNKIEPFEVNPPKCGSKLFYGDANLLLVVGIVVQESLENVVVKAFSEQQKKVIAVVGSNQIHDVFVLTICQRLVFTEQTLHSFSCSGKKQRAVSWRGADFDGTMCSSL